MGLKSVPNASLYRSNCVIFRDNYLPDRISRNRNYELTRYLHCIEVPDSSDKLSKVSIIIINNNNNNRYSILISIIIYLHYYFIQL